MLYSVWLSAEHTYQQITAAYTSNNCYWQFQAGFQYHGELAVCSLHSSSASAHRISQNFEHSGSSLDRQLLLPHTCPGQLSEITTKQDQSPRIHKTITDYLLSHDFIIYTKKMTIPSNAIALCIWLRKRETKNLSGSVYRTHSTQQTPECYKDPNWSTMPSMSRRRGNPWPPLRAVLW